ncbi:MAG TPA: hypothetical protein VGC74_18055 [Stenotrophomonas sp.]|jgi:hypothetical protein
MRLPRPLALSLVIGLAMAAAAPVFAQRTVNGDLQQQMTSAQFKAAGLDKLSAQELASLNNWLQGKVATESQAAAKAATAAALESAREEGRQEVITKNRGFFDFGRSDPIESTLPGQFRGFGKGNRFVLANGQEWEQTDSASYSGPRKSDLTVKLKPGVAGVWYLQVQGVNTQPKVRRVK